MLGISLNLAASSLFLATAPAIQTDLFEGMSIKETLHSPHTLHNVERCILASSVPAYPVRLDNGEREIIFFLTAQTGSGRNPLAWRLVTEDNGTKLEIYEGKRAINRARKCFAT